jgi:hypothetical protein
MQRTISAGTGMRVKPSALTAILAILGYMVVVFAVWGATGLKYDEVGDTVENVQKGVVLAIALGAVYLVIVTTVFGWWKPVMREPRKVGGGWMWLIPAVLLVGTIGNLAGTKWGEIDRVGAYALWLAIGTLLVGFSEELLTRGLAIVGGRGSMQSGTSPRSSSTSRPGSATRSCTTHRSLRRSRRARRFATGRCSASSRPANSTVSRSRRAARFAPP